MIPSDVYWNVESQNFYSSKTKQGMGNSFYNEWKSRSEEFPHCDGFGTLTQDELKMMYNWGYRYHLRFIGSPPITPLCVKTLGEIGPLMREFYPEYRVHGCEINLDGTLVVENGDTNDSGRNGMGLL